MISTNKKYQTRCGLKVCIAAKMFDAIENEAVIGWVKKEDGWTLCSWDINGNHSGSIDDPYDLVEIPAFKPGQLWENIHTGERLFIYRGEFGLKYKKQSGGHSDIDFARKNFELKLLVEANA